MLASFRHSTVDIRILRGLYRFIYTRNSDIKRFVMENTEIVSDKTLTPEIRLNLFTPNCQFWHARPDTWPFSDPYWAIYWPGGQALSRQDQSVPIKNSLVVQDLFPFLEQLVPQQSCINCRPNPVDYINLSRIKIAQSMVIQDIV